MLKDENYERLSKLIDSKLQERKHLEQQLLELEKVKRGLNDKIKTCDTELVRLYQERNGQQALF